MSEEHEFDAERLRPLEYVCEADPRSDIFVKINRQTGQTKEFELADHHEGISHFVLHDGVPEDVLIQFETARNLYLYAWFVYRFYPVSERHALSTLEYALRDVLGERHKQDWEEKDRQRLEKKPNAKKRKYKLPTLFPLLQYAIEKEIIRNEHFSDWHRGNEIRSRDRYKRQKFQELRDSGLDQITYDDDDEIEITEEDKKFDYVSQLPDILSAVRNDYAHGSRTLHNHVLKTFETVSEIINQLYPLEVKETEESQRATQVVHL